MHWLQVLIRTASDGIELLCTELTNAGFDSFVVEDDEEFHEFLNESKDYWDYVDDTLSAHMRGLSQVRLFLPAEDAPQRMKDLRSLLASLPQRYPECHFGSLTIALDALQEEDWENSWKKNYRPLPVGEKLLIVPQWMTVEDLQGRLPVILDLGLTFGTGEHASTRMCIRMLERLIHGGEYLLDLGSGSGILSVCALRLGAASAVGIDIDPAAEHIARNNAVQNGFGADRFQAHTGNVISDHERMEALAAGGYDIVCANIVAGVLVRLMPIVSRFLRPKGCFLCSGILNEREAEVRQAALEAGLRIVDALHEDEWCCLLAEANDKMI